ncbi:MAG: helix-turn-helix transcriptional regulator [Lyngbya sp.]|nr:helix-turn-helix transcriptional regulator [Lyngbya sp.]
MAVAFETKSVIRWKLRQIMSDRMVSNRALAEFVGIHETNISNMKRRDDMPRIDGDTLNKLCLALNCTPSDLIEFEVRDSEKGLGLER